MLDQVHDQACDEVQEEVSDEEYKVRLPMGVRRVLQGVTLQLSLRCTAWRGRAGSEVRDLPAGG